MKYILDKSTFNEDFLQKVQKISGQKITACYQCGKCSAGCPVCKEMDITPNQIIRYLQLGIKSRILMSRSIWLCASCQTCSIRCPQMIDLAKIMDSLRIIAQKENLKINENNYSGLIKGFWNRIKESFIYIFQMDIKSNRECFNSIFLDSIYYYGRIYEPGLIYNYNINSGYLFSNFLKAPLMLLKSKINFIPEEIQRIEKVQKIFERIESLEKGEEKC